MRDDWDAVSKERQSFFSGRLKRVPRPGQTSSRRLSSATASTTSPLLPTPGDGTTSGPSRGMDAETECSAAHLARRRHEGGLLFSQGGSKACEGSFSCDPVKLPSHE